MSLNSPVIFFQGNYSGKFNLRISPELHERLAVVTEAEGKTLSSLAREALQKFVQQTGCPITEPHIKKLENMISRFLKTHREKLRNEHEIICPF
ncbi:toxin-antitoxin system HicB family antitoxin [Desulfonema magnum]|uniref:HicB family domain-containing protein n=1 Tax=Desulfonema magnum TaxID=45655 RepID=A0A975GQP2_9BACT|nr:HicB family domain-containing protein [Desulfonema magnum]